MLRAVTWLPDWVTAAFQALVTRWSPGQVQVTVQPLTGVDEVLVTVTSAVKPLFQVLAT